MGAPSGEREHVPKQSLPHNFHVIVNSADLHNPNDGHCRAPDMLSEVYGSMSSSDNLGRHAMNARRSLRRYMKDKLAESSHSFVVALGEVDEVRLFRADYVSAF